MHSGTKYSLPSIAFDAMYNHSDQNLPLVYTFPDSKDGDAVRLLFRSNVAGGISNVNHRYLEMLDIELLLYF